MGGENVNRRGTRRALFQLQLGCPDLLARSIDNCSVLFAQLFRRFAGVFGPAAEFGQVGQQVFEVVLRIRRLSMRADASGGLVAP